MFSRNVSRLLTNYQFSTCGCIRNCQCSAVSIRHDAPNRNWSFFATKRKVSGPASSSNVQQGDAFNKSDASRVSTDIRPEQHVKSIKRNQKKTMAQMDEELRLAMEGRAGDGGDSGLELEDGKPVSMKRGVRDNMFRYI